jgi:hypothetical protein
MSSYKGFPVTKTLIPEIYVLDGYVETKNDGTVVNTASSTTASKDVFSNFLYLPRGFSSISRSSAGLYACVLEQPWPKLVSVHLTLQSMSVLSGTLQVKGWNPTNTVVNGVAARTILVSYEVSGSAAELRDSGFFIQVVLSNSNLPV